MRKKAVILLGILLLITISIGISYASWVFGGTQKNFNTLGSKCFELTMTNESEGITLEKAYPITDQEGLATEGYTFTIKNTCNTYATYEVNLEDLLLSENEKSLSEEYIKVSINDGTPKSLITYEEKAPVIEGSDKAYELTTGSLAPDSEVTYTIKLWLDEETPAIEEAMNATFESKVSIEAGYIEEENLENEILLQANSQTEEINNQKETFEITGTSTNYNLIEYSLDNSHWTRIDEPSKNVTITYDFEEEKTYTFYVRDEVGNIKNIEITPTKLDKTAPRIDIEEIDNQESINLNITLVDEKDSNISYAITETIEKPSEWNTYTEKISFEITENKTYYIWAQDGLGNTTYQAYSATTIDTTPPELTIANSLTTWGAKDTITIQATDDVIGISGISISTSENTYNWEVVENTLNYETTKEVTSNGTYYISVKDAYEHITTKSIAIDKIDDINPTIESISSDTNWGTTNHITAILKDEESGLSGYQITRENTEPTEWISITGNSYSLNYEATENGTYYVWIKDELGNIFNSSIEVNRIDTTAPVANFTTTATETSITINASSSTDAESGVANYQYSKDNGSSWYTSTSSSYTFTGLTAGTAYLVSVKVEDNAGNESEKADKNAFTPQRAVEYITTLASTSDELVYDNTVDNNLRYIGANPNNYVQFNNELWRIIGVFNNIDDGTGTKETRLKIIRNEPIGVYSWDNKTSGTGSSISSGGSNDWSDSRLMMLLNPGYETPNSPIYEYEGSLYYNGKSGTCYSGHDGATVSCDFTNTGLQSTEAKEMIGSAVWKLGGSRRDDDITASTFYERERGTEVYEGRPTEWTGKIGLMYVSDYGYATSGGSTTNRETCLNTALYDWDSSSVSDCKNNDWLHYSLNNQWTLTPISGYSNYVFIVYRGGGLLNSTALGAYTAVSPALYLTSYVKITGGNGTSSSPFTLSL